MQKVFPDDNILNLNDFSNEIQNNSDLDQQMEYIPISPMGSCLESTSRAIESGLNFS